MTDAALEREEDSSTTSPAAEVNKAINQIIKVFLNRTDAALLRVNNKITDNRITTIRSLHNVLDRTIIEIIIEITIETTIERIMALIVSTVTITQVSEEPQCSQDHNHKELHKIAHLFDRPIKSNSKEISTSIKQSKTSKSWRKR